MSNEIKTVNDLAHKMVNMGDVENEFGALVSPTLLIHDANGKELVMKNFYLRGDNKAFMILDEVKE